MFLPLVNSKTSSVSSSALDAVARRASPAEDDEDAINVKILVNDITPASSQEFLQASNPSSRRSSASDVRHSPSGNSIGGNTAQRLAKKHLQQSPESQRRQSWSDLTKAGVAASSAATGGSSSISSSGSPKGKRSHRSPIKLQRSVSLNSLETAGESGGPEIAEKSDVHTSGTEQQGINAKQQSPGGNAAKPPSGASQQVPQPRGVPTQLPLSGEHNYSMQPPPSPRTHRSASSGEAMLLLNRREDLQSGATSILGGAAAPLAPKMVKPLPPGVQSKKDHSLQKSISTPSIVVAQETLIQHSQSDSRVEEHPLLVHQLSVGNQIHLRVGAPHKNLLLHSQRSKVHLLEEEDEFDDSSPVHDYVASVYRSQSATGRPVAASGLLNSNATSASAADSDDEKFIGKRTKKRGSLFFRRKKAKDSKTGSPTPSGGTPSPPPARALGHQFVAVPFNSASVQCHVCSKSLTSKAVLRCELCLVAVHEHSCRDQIADCTKFKSLLPKSMLINKSASQLTGKDRSTANLASALKSSASSLSSKDRKQGTSSRSNLQNAPLQNDTTGGSSKESSPSSAAKGTTDELDSPYGLHCEMSDYYAQNLNMQDVNSASMESLDSGASVEELAEIDDPYLRLLDDEPQQWSATVDKKVIKKLKERDVKRQEAIYELILTEKHHYLTLRIMEKLYYDGMLSELQLAPEVVNKMFPRLGELLAFHGDFLKSLRTRQSQANPDNQTIDSVADVLIHMFQAENATKMLNAYGDFCSKHKDAVAVYKEILKADKKFTIYVAKRSRLALCKGRGIPECILLVTQRLTKYPLLIDALIKSSKDHPEEIERLKTAQILIKDVINGVNAQVAEAERDARLLEIYHKIDAKSSAYLKDHKFKKSDLLSSNRKLRYEGTISLRNARGKQIDVTAVMLSDVIFFLQENNQKYIFAAFDNKPSVISLHKLLVRERAGQDARALYLISSNAEVPEMFEFICGSPKEKGVWLEAIRKAIETCPAETDDSQEKDAEEVARSDRLRRLQISLHDGDRQIAQICQEKLAILSEMLETIGVDQETIDKLNPRDFKYTDLLQKLSPEETNQMLLTAASQVHQIFAQIPIPQLFSTANAAEGNSRKDSTDGAHQSLGRSVSSAAIKKKLFLIGAESAAAKERTKKDTSREFPECHLQVKDKSLQRRSVTGLDNPGLSDSTQDAPPAPLPLHQLEGLSPTPLFFTNDPREKLEIISDLTHNLSIVMCLYCQSASSMESLRLQTTEMSEQLQCRNPRKQSYRPDLQLEELRNLQEQLTQERTEWHKQCQAERQQLARQREEIEKLQEQIRRDQEDIEQQRDWLFRRLEKLDKTREIGQLPISSSTVSQQGSPLHSTQHSQQTILQTTHVSSPPSVENSPRGSLQGRAVSSVDLMAPAMLSVMPFDMRSSQSTTSLLPFHLSSLGGPQSGSVLQCSYLTHKSRRDRQED
ncbi:rho guanine nucleotide exchange factor 18 [Galendromus occidentalis]|uniref:Rho guanine nucleotide exchange factor 18 n=1 Tax=Galendromus occidentalis TaxID=34638 RepID=A0AAJ7SJC7_9ACAR|nr:rho guanine nucleotide exchange factor 18 [Galendromus occidentalis]